MTDEERRPVKLKLLVTSVLLLMSAYAVRAQSKYRAETKNAALRYWMAFAEMQDPPLDNATQELLQKTVAGDATWDENKLGPILDANSAAILVMQRATKLPDCDWGLEYGRGPRASIGYAPRARVLARLNTLEGMRQMANGNPQEAVDTWLAGIRFSRHLSDGGSLIFTLIAKSALLPNLRALTVAKKQGHLSDSQRQQISTPLKQMREDGFDWSAAWGLEELGGEQFLAELRSAKNPGTTYQTLMGEPMPNGANAPSSEDVRNYREYMKAAQAVLNLSPDTAKMRLSALEAQERALPVIVQRIIPNAQKENDARTEIFAARKELLETLSAM
jgi:hypothetical protein